ncbi:MAG: hypothetical protein GY754_46380 [bacterium]|nr:hypothetical protein [bacterium]
MTKSKTFTKFFYGLSLFLAAFLALTGCGSGFGEDSVSDSAAVAEDRAALAGTPQVNFLSGRDKFASVVTENLSLPASGDNGTSIAWAAAFSSDGADASTVIDSNGKVFRPAYGSGNAPVTLTATISKGSAVETVSFDFIVYQGDYVTASNGEANDRYGYAAALSADGNYILSGAHNHTEAGGNYGSSFFYSWNGSTWDETIFIAFDSSGGDHYGYAVDISSDGSRVLIGAWADDDKGDSSGSAYVYELIDNSWYAIKLTAFDGAGGDSFGKDLAMSDDGNTIVISSIYDDDKGSNSGSVSVFRWNGWTWVEKILTASDGTTNDWYGCAVDVSSDGKRVVVGAVYDNEDSESTVDCGSIYVYTLEGDTWSEKKLIVDDRAESDILGNSVAISGDGNTVIAGAPGVGDGLSNYTGAAYIFKWDGSSWIETTLTAFDGAGDDYFGLRVSISYDGTRVIVGAYKDDNEESDDPGLAANQGSAYVFTLNGSAWDEEKLVAADGAAGDNYGDAVSMSTDGNTVLIGASCDDNAGTDAGSVYVYRWNGSAWQ